jgi:hypothetical protein
MNGTYVSASLRAIANEIGTITNVPVRLRFEPFGRPVVGHPGKGRNRILYAEAHLAVTFPIDSRPTLWFDAGGVRYVLTDGRRYRDHEWEHFDVAPEAGHLGDLGWVLGRESPDGDGFVPVGVGVEVAMPE